MDGFAIRAADSPATLPVVGRIAAGRPAERALEAGEAMAIATGGVVPDGADAVVPIEDVEERDGAVVVPGGAGRARTSGPRRGLVTGDPVVPPVSGSGRALGALAAAGVTSVR